jgi:hypothetical protein
MWDMATRSVFGITVDRLCRIRSGTVDDDLPFPLDTDGFLDPTVVRNGSAQALVPGALVSVRAAAEAGALVLLGEPGVGKTTEFNALGGSRGHSPTGSLLHRVIEVDAADLTDATYDELLGRHFRTLPEKRDQDQSGGTGAILVGRSGTYGPATALTVIIDQVDESQLIRQLAARLRISLHGRETSRLRLVLGCRTADYPSDLTDVLKSIFHECILADLAPLTRVEAVRLAGSADDVDGEQLIAAAVEAGAAALANVPLTLGLLVRAYRQTGSLNARPTELFALGVLQLLDEPDQGRQVVDDVSSVQQRMAVAGRIAARLLLSGRRTIWRGTVLEAGEQDLNADSLVGGQETCPSGPFAVPKKLVLATLATGLFTGRGTNRLAFRHGSFAAYLAARFLVDRGVPRAQLERMFLAAGGDNSRSVPTQLREAAAWLVTIHPAHGEWLIEADPESLVPHSPIVDSAEVRALIIEALLRRASEVELGDQPWARARRRLSHPGLGAQLMAVLEETGGQEPQDWPALARVRLAVRLARETKIPELAAPLLDFATNNTWSVYIRMLAALAAFEAAPDEAAPRLTTVLERLADVDYASQVDPDDELRGALLDMLWPRYIRTEQVLPHLRRRRNRNLLGTYFRFEQTFAPELPEEDLYAVLGWAKDQLDDRGRTPAVTSSDDDPQGPEQGPSGERPVGGLDIELLEGIVERGLTGPDAPDRVQIVAEIVRPRLDRFDHPPLPAPVDVEDQDGQEPATARDLRHALALSLVELCLTNETVNRAEIWEIIYGWGAGPPALRLRDTTIPEGLRRAHRGQLLTAADFAWAYHATSTASSGGDYKLAEALAQVAAFLFDPAHVSSSELIYANQDHPAWPYVKWWFEPVAVDSEQANLWRQAHGHRGGDKEDEPWTGREEFTAKLNQWLVDAAAGDIDAFWRLAYQLQAEPATGKGVHRNDDDLLNFPGVAALGGNHLDLLIEAAGHFLATGHDHAAEWLGTDRYDRRGWAGYLALALLERQGRLSDVPDHAWASWVGALVWFHAVPVNAGDRDIKIRLLARAAQHAAAQLADAAAKYLRGELMHGRFASEVDLIDPAWHEMLADTWSDLLVEIAEAITSADDVALAGKELVGETAGSTPLDGITNGRLIGPTTLVLSTDESRGHALDTWETMLGALLRSNDTRGAEVARRALDTHSCCERHQLVAVRAARALLRADAAAHLFEIMVVAERDPVLGREIALACATQYDERSILNDLDEEQLASVYRWLSSLFPPEDDMHREGAHFVSQEEQAWDWRDRILWRLGERGTERAVLALAKLREEYPHRLILTSNLLRARTNMFATAWSPPSPDELAALFQDSRRRLVRSERELADLLLDVIEAIGTDLPAHGELLWDRLPKHVLPEASPLAEAWLPKPEAALSAYIAHELANRLEGRGLAVNREVLVRPTNAYGAGDRTDIQVEAAMRDDVVSGPTPDRFTVVIEVKGPWNNGLTSDQREQLAKRYLPETHTATGIYLVGWFPLHLWTDADDYRRRAAETLAKDELAAELEAQANDIAADLHVRTIPLLLTIPRPHHLAHNAGN